MDFESSVGHLQAFPACTKPLGNQAFQLELVPGGTALRAMFGKPAGADCVAMLAAVAPPPPAPVPKHAPNETLSGYWRPRFHPTGFTADGLGHLQDPSAPFQDAAGIWHVFPDCTPMTWNAGVTNGLHFIYL